MQRTAILTGTVCFDEYLGICTVVLLPLISYQETELTPDYDGL